MDMPFSFVTKNMVFSYTPSVTVKKEVGKKGKDKPDGKEDGGQGCWGGKGGEVVDERSLIRQT